ncbi:MAG: TetR/AcrR family transcriptional regulator [Armatimonadetes bacterium]|nr:TetR/AcrR family transcriptional regulator [Armatimonadota bacterium]
MGTPEEKKLARGRPRSMVAASHQAILDAVYELLHETSVRDLTMEAIAKRANVGKPTLYKWWSSKAALVMDMYEQRIVERLPAPTTKTAEATIRVQVTETIHILNGFMGKVAAGIIAEGQSDPDVLREYQERYVRHRRAFTTQAIEAAIANGEFVKVVDPALLIDMIYGPIYYRLLVKHERLDQKFGSDLVDNIMAIVKR